MKKVYLSPTQFKLIDACVRHWVLNYPCNQRHEEVPARGKMLGSLMHAGLEAHFVAGNIYHPDLDKLKKEIDAFLAHEAGEAIKAIRNTDSREYKSLLKAYGVKEIEKALICEDNAKAFGYTVANDVLKRLKDDAPQRAAMVLPHLPTRNTHTITAEHKLKMDIRTWDPQAEWEVASGTAIDLLAQPHAGAWVEIYDYKSTKGAQVKKGLPLKHGGTSTGWDPWFYVPTEEELAKDPQVIFYAAYALEVTGLDVVYVTFIYVCTSGAPQVTKRTIRLTAEEVIGLLEELIFPKAREMVELHGRFSKENVHEVNTLKLPVLPYEDRRGPCQAYGGCPHANTKGGKCQVVKHDVSLGGLARIGATKMGLFDQAKKLDKANAMRAPEALKAAANAEPEAEGALDVPEVETEPSNTPKVEVPAAKPPVVTGKPRRTSKDTDETFAARMREWEKANNVVVTEGEEVKAPPAPAAAPKASSAPAPAPAAPVTVTIEGEALPNNHLECIFRGPAAEVRDLIRRLGGAL